LDLARERLLTQRLAGPPLATAVEVVRHLGAVQAQDYPAVKWAVAQRTPGLDAAAIERELASGAILRTHVLRPTWHLVLPADVRWMLALTAPRILAQLAHAFRGLQLDARTIARASSILARAVEGGRHLTRPELAAALARGRVDASDPRRLAYILVRAELDAVLVSGAHRGKQATHALLDERAPAAPPLDRDQALAALAVRYLAGHGPASVRDLAWWAGLNLGDARRGVAAAGPLLARGHDGETWYTAGAPPPRRRATRPAALLLPNYDEYVVGYADRRALFRGAPIELDRADPRRNIVFHHPVIVDGKILGVWTRALGKTVSLTARLFLPLRPPERAAVEAAAARYGRYLGLPVELRLERASDVAP
jgi:hypothetical protein